MKKILLLILEGAELLEIAPFTDVFGWHNAFRKEKIHIVTGGLSEEVRCCWNLKLIPEIVLSPSDSSYRDFDAIVIPGGFGSSGYFKNLNAPLLNEIFSYFSQNEKLIVGICTGSILLGNYGVLKNRRATTYLSESGRYFKQLEALGAIPVFEEIVEDGNLITTSAPGSALKTAFYLLEKFSDVSLASMIKREMGFEF